MEENKDILTKLAEQYGVSRREAFLMVRRAWISSTIEGDAFGQNAATVLDDMGIDPNIGNTPAPTKADANSKDIRERFNEKNLIGTASLDPDTDTDNTGEGDGNGGSGGDNGNGDLEG